MTECGREKRLEMPSVSKLLKVGQLLLLGLEYKKKLVQQQVSDSTENLKQIKRPQTPGKR